MKLSEAPNGLFFSVMIDGRPEPFVKMGYHTLGSRCCKIATLENGSLLIDFYSLTIIEDPQKDKRIDPITSLGLDSMRCLGLVKE